MSPDLKARRVLMASWLYYEQGVSVITDAEFDRLCADVAEELEWNEAMGECDIDPLRVFQLGTAEELRATGCHVWLTYATVGGAISWWKEVSGDEAWVLTLGPRHLAPLEEVGLQDAQGRVLTT